VEQSNRAKDEFLAMLGHELRNPLAAIVMAADLIDQNADDATTHERAIVQRQVKQLVRLVDDLLDVARVTRGKTQLKRQTVEIAQVLATAAETVSYELTSRRHRLELSVDGPKLFVYGDPDRLCQIVANLLVNAVKYTPPGGRIGLMARLDAAQVIIEVTDNGIGISAALLPKLFEPFVQGERAIDRSEGGMGIGLTLVKGLVNQHGGTVCASSEGPGRGSTFTIRLPAVPHPGETVAQTAAQLPAASVRAPQRVLVVDDNADAAELTAAILRRRGHSVEIEHDGDAAVRAAETFRPDVALLDIGLPGLDGWRLAATLRERMAQSCPRLIALTGYGQESDRLRSRAAGFDAHLVKPVDAKRILALLGDSDGRNMNQ
jgi:CheY-like chemotaxis protein